MWNLVAAWTQDVQAVRDAVGEDFGFGADFHGRVHKPMAKILIKELVPHRSMFIEEPVLRTRDAIEAQRGATRESKPTLSWSDVKVVLSKRKLRGIYIGQFCLTSTLWFFLTWFPTYLVDYRGMEYIESGFMASLPFIAALIGVLFSGWVSDPMVKRGLTLGTAKKLPIIIGLALTVFMLGANYTDSSAWVIVFMSIAFFGNGFASITWSLVSALAPARLLGLTGGMFNFIGNLSSIATPIVIGFLVAKTDFGPAFVYMAAVTIVGVLSYVFLVGRVERVEE